MRIALVHDWMTGMRGGEYVFEAIAELFPKAELFTLLYVPNSVSPTISVLKRHTSPLQKMPGAEKRYRSFLPLMPRWIEKFDLSEFDLIVSSSHCVAKGVQKKRDAVHVSYVHAPMRYMWDRFDDYFGPGKSSLPVRMAATFLRKRFQKWDRQVSQPNRVDTMIANSQYIADQIEKAYGRKSQVIYPFSDLSRFNRPRLPGKSYLMVGAFAPNKRVEIAVEAFNRLKLSLLIVGGGQNRDQIAKIAGPTIELLGNLSNDAIADLYSKCKAFVFPGKEDFGITPLEAMAAGAPVIAFGEGGVLESVTAETGVFFNPQTADALVQVIERFEHGEFQFSEKASRERAKIFSRQRFQKELATAILQTWKARGKNPDLLKLGEFTQT